MSPSFPPAPPAVNNDHSLSQAQNEKNNEYLDCEKKIIENVSKSEYWLKSNPLYQTEGETNWGKLGHLL